MVSCKSGFMAYSGTERDLTSILYSTLPGLSFIQKYSNLAPDFFLPVCSSIFYYNFTDIARVCSREVSLYKDM